MSAIAAVGGGSPVTPVSPAGNASGSGRVEAGSLLPEPTAGIGGNSVIAIAMLMCKMNSQDRTDETKTEDAANVAAAQDNAQRVQQMEQKAQDDETGAVVSGVASIVGGGLTVLSGVEPANPSGIDKRLILQGASTGAQGAGTAIAGNFKFASDMDDAGAAKAQAAADADGRAYNHAESQAQAAAQSIQQVEQYLQGILQTQAATASAATGYRG